MNGSHWLLAFLFIMGVGDQFFITRLKLPHGPKTKQRSYWLVLGWLWIATIWAVSIVGARTLWYADVDPSEVSWIPGKLATAIIALISFAVLLMPLWSIWRSPRAARKVSFALDRLRFFLPTNSTERFLWVLLSITAGVCEETLFRSFLLQYFRSTPWQLGLAGSVVLACFLFGLGHLYQGAVAAFGTMLLAVVFFLLFLGSGSLLLPMLLHVAADARVVGFMRLADGPNG